MVEKMGQHGAVVSQWWGCCSPAPAFFMVPPTALLTELDWPTPSLLIMAVSGT